MKVLLDECLPVRLRLLLTGHDVFTVHYMDWLGVRNSRLLRLAAGQGFDALVTVDSGFAHQQDTEALPLAVILLRSSSNAIDDLQPLVPEILAALEGLQPGSLVRVGS